MKLRWILAFVLAALFGGAQHFFYDWLPIPLVGLFAPVNESVWEHLKLLFWPFLLFSVPLAAGEPERQRFWGAALSAELVMPPVLLGAYYLLSAGFGVQGLGVDLALYAGVLALGFGLCARWRREVWPQRALGVLILVCSLYAASLVLFSIAAPELPVFRSKS